MFDIGFSELIVIGLVALIVIGPQRLPTVARTVGHLLGRLQRYVGDVKSDIKREMQIEELKKLQDDVIMQAHEMEQQVTEQLVVVETELNASIAAGIEAKAEAAEPVLPAAAAGALPAVSPKGTSFGAPPEPTLAEPAPHPDKPAA